MITAKEAYEIANPMFDVYVEFLDKSIREAAEKGETYVLIRQSPYCGWLYDERKLEDKDAKKVIALLRENGFKLGLYYQELQLVDIGLEISWGQPK